MKYRIMRSQIVCLMLFAAGVLLTSLPVSAISFSISEQDINRFVQAAFPQKKSYQGTDIFFSDPIVTIDDATGSLRISTEITAIKNRQMLKARGSLSGELAYDPADYNLQVKNPTLSEFTVQESSMDDTAELLDTIRSVVGESLPLIVLIDLSRFDIGLGEIKPQSIEIDKKKLVITL
ncbi:DUF1439 domain-containing protein [Alteromonas oceanisediminis]|uniref:DUF1439 domain-containing protein n=1 Tax=Alteromonas oceanisediminis TaxID=2836180 RepID=UPI001BD9A638|nr:DUF1439 domain-containing protein [Alteromonas oceanisediminis]MBT0586828.1 DUF1439 domain-containing protein [Alteromonas oceanisediminis]